MRVLLGVAAFLAFLHVTGELLGGPVLRWAEVLALLAVLAAAVLRGLPRPRWVLPVALAVLVADAVRTLPAPADTAQYLAPSDFEWALPSVVAFGATWATLAFALLLIPLARAWPSRWTAVPAVAVIAYLVARPGGLTSGGTVLPVLLSLVALGVAGALYASGHRLAATGAALSALCGLLILERTRHLLPAPPDTAFLTVGVLLDGGTYPLPALIAALQLTAVMLVVTGLTRKEHPVDARA